MSVQTRALRSHVIQNSIQTRTCVLILQTFSIWVSQPERYPEPEVGDHDRMPAGQQFTAGARSIRHVVDSERFENDGTGSYRLSAPVPPIATQASPSVSPPDGWRAVPLPLRPPTPSARHIGRELQMNDPLLRLRTPSPEGADVAVLTPDTPTCGRCYRPLASRASIRRGHVKACCSMIRREGAQVTECKPAQVAQSLEVLDDRDAPSRTRPVRGGLKRGHLSTKPHRMSCSCRSGFPGRRCWNRLAVPIVAAA